MKEAKGMDFLLLAMLAFAGIGLEVLLAYGIEPFLYGGDIGVWSDLQHILHWIVTCALWGSAAAGIIRLAKKKYGFDLFQRGKKMAVWQWVLTVVLVIMSLVISWYSWNGSKVLKEF